MDRHYAFGTRRSLHFSDADACCGIWGGSDGARAGRLLARGGPEQGYLAALRVGVDTRTPPSRR